MKYIQKKAWLIWGMVLLALLLNVLIINVSNRNQYLLWLLIVSFPLFLTAIYFAWKNNHLLQRYFIDSFHPSVELNNFEWWSNSGVKNSSASIELNVLIGNDQCSQPYNACIFNIGTMVNVDQETIIFGTQENSGYSIDERLEIYHLVTGDLIFQIGPRYLGCRTENGHFNSKVFKKIARQPEVKMIELKLSSAKNTNNSVDSFLGLEEPIDRKKKNSIFSDSAFTTFIGAEGMIHFLDNLRELSGGKPIGIRISIIEKREFYQICYAIRKTQLIPDFIVVEGSLENTGVGHSDQAFHTRMPLYEALLFVSQTLQLYGLENKIKIIADGSVISCFDILKVLALGANMICTELPRYRIMKYSGNAQKLSIQLKSRNLYDFHNSLLKDTVQIMKVCGFRNVNDITLSKVVSRLDVVHPKNFAKQNGTVSYQGAVQKVYN